MPPKKKNEESKEPKPIAPADEFEKDVKPVRTNEIVVTIAGRPALKTVKEGFIGHK